MYLLRRAIYFLRKALGSVRENPFLNAVTVATIAIAMTLLGGFLLAFLNLRAVVDRLGSDVEISAYFADGAPPAAVARLTETLSDREEISQTVFVSREEALETFKRQNPEDVPLLDELGENPFPASIQVRLARDHRDAETVARLAADLAAESIVAEVEYGQEWIGRFTSFLGLVRAAGLLLAAMIVLAVVFVVSNTIRLAIFARRDELEIMRLVGATDRFIRGPYLLEGIFQGGAGTAVALVALWLLWRSSGAESVASIAPFLGSSRLLFFSPREVALLVAGGMGLGLVGSYFAMGRFLRSTR